MVHKTSTNGNQTKTELNWILSQGYRVQNLSSWHASCFMLLLLSHFSRVRLCATLWTAAHQALPFLGFSRQEHWSGLPFPSLMHESEKWKWSRSVVSDSSWPHGLQPTRLLRPQDFPGNSTGVGCHCLLRWFTLLCMIISSCIHVAANGFVFFCGWVVFHCIYEPHVYPFICWWTFRLVPCLAELYGNSGLPGGLVVKN